MDSTQNQILRVTALTLLGFAIVTVLVIGRPLLMPIVFSLVLAFVLSPIVRALERQRVPSGVAVSLVVTIVTLIATIGFTFVGQQISSLLSALPAHTETLKVKVSALRFTQGSGFSGLWKIWDDIAEELEKNAPSSESAVPVVVQSDSLGADYSLSFLWPMLEPFGAVALVVVLVIFLLVSRADIRNRMLAIVGTQRLAGTSHLMEEVGERLGRYLLCLCTVNFAFAVLFGIALSLIGVPFPFLWSFLTGVLRFIPYVGSTLSMLLPAVLALATLPGWGSALAVVLVFGFLEFTSGNLVEPWLFGRSVGLNPVGVILSIAFWAWAWGAGGMVLAMPLTLSIVVLAKYIPQLHWISVLLGNETPLPPQLVLYQRLMAGDVSEAVSICQVNEDHRTMIRALDAMLVPALLLAKRESSGKSIGSDDYQRVLHATRGAYQDPAKLKHASPGSESPFKVTVVPLQSEVDEVLGEILAKVLHLSPAADCLPKQTISEAPITLPRDAYVISALPNHNMPELLKTFQNLRQLAPQTPIVVLYWRSLNHPGKLRRFMTRRLGEPVLLTTCSAEAISTLLRLRSARDHNVAKLAAEAVEVVNRNLASASG